MYLIHYKSQRPTFDNELEVLAALPLLIDGDAQVWSSVSHGGGKHLDGVLAIAGLNQFTPVVISQVNDLHHVLVPKHVCRTREKVKRCIEFDVELVLELYIFGILKEWKLLSMQEDLEKRECIKSYYRG